MSRQEVNARLPELSLMARGSHCAGSRNLAFTFIDMCVL